MPVLSVRHLTKKFGAKTWTGRTKYAVTAVEDASLDLYPGENLGIVGESGSGKTTLGRMMLRIVEPTAGQITFRPGDGSEIDVMARSKRGLADYHRQVRLVFQDPYASLNPRMTVKQIIGDPLYVTRTARGAALTRKVGDLLELVGLERGGDGALPARLLRRPAPAHRHRPRARARPQGHHRRRGDLGARRLDPRPNPRPAARGAEAARP